MDMLCHLSMIAMFMVLLARGEETNTTQDLVTNDMTNKTGQTTETMQPVTHVPPKGDTHMADQEHTMAMYFTISDHATVLFSFWKTESPLGMFVSCLAVFLMAAIYEVLLNLPIIQNCHLPSKSGTSPLADAIKNGYGTMDGTLEIKPNSMFSRLRTIWQSLHKGGGFMLRRAGHHLLMLIIMTYNLWLILAVILGGAVGYIIVWHMKSKRKERDAAQEEGMSEEEEP